MVKKMHTKDKLAAALREIGLDEMAVQAESGWYHDFLSPLAMPEMQLIRDLTEAMHANDPDAGQSIALLRKRVIDGDFDASTEESEAWSKSHDGKQTFAMLVRELGKK